MRLPEPAPNLPEVQRGRAGRAHLERVDGERRLGEPDDAQLPCETVRSHHRTRRVARGMLRVSDDEGGPNMRCSERANGRYSASRSRLRADSETKVGPRMRTRRLEAARDGLAARRKIDSE